MKTGTPSHFLRRAISLTLPQKPPLHQLGSVARVHAVGLHPTALDSAMLHRAVDVKKAADANGQGGLAARNRSLSKQLFSSSSPSSSAGQNGSLVDVWKKPKASSSSFQQPQRLGTTSNASTTRTTQRPTTGNSNFRSIYNNPSDSFTDAPDIIDLTSTKPTTTSQFSQSKEMQDMVYISENDFSDDDNLSFLEPTSLPAMPKANAHSAPEPPPATNTSTLSWSQSSPSHFAPRVPDAVSKFGDAQRTLAVKRDSPENPAPAPQPAKKAKRELPWKVKQDERDENDIEFLYEAAPQPPVKAKKESPFWNETASEVQARKKQLKVQQKDAAPKKDVSVEEAHQAMKSSGRKSAGKSAIKLSEEQEHVKSLVVDRGQSVFFTGPAGTGKSVLMRAIIADLKKKYAREPDRVAVTASTGLAACNIGGMTLHSFSGIGLGKEDANTLVKKIRRNPKAKTRWLKTKVLVIDEISMVDGDLFDKLSQIGRVIRNNGRPWGGIQLVITGDFFQLPPVPDGPSQRDVKFAFDAATWNMSIDHTIGLTEVFRQRDPEFAQMLNEMRLGRISERTIQNFKALSRPLNNNDHLEVTELFPTRNEVENANRKRLQALEGKSRFFQAMDTGAAEKTMRDKLLANMMAPPTLELKKGAQVMLIKNMDETLVNGSLGTVLRFMSESAFDRLGESGGDLSDGESDFKKRTRAFENKLDTATDEYPLVRFHAVDGTSRDLLCVPEDWKVELPTGEVQASRKQLPLILAWALSIHKAQGQTLERVKVDLGKVFEKGQAYVALSRATTQQGLQVLRFQKEKVMAHPHVVNFYNKLYSVETAMTKKKPTTLAEFATKSQSAKLAPKATMAKRETSRVGRSNDFHEDEEALAAAYGC